MKRPYSTGAAFGLFLLAAAPAAAQPGLAFRPFVMAVQQQFAAQTTFEAVFGRRTQRFFGGGLNITDADRYYLELSASRFEQTGQRAFVNGGRLFRVGIPLTATITPFEATGGYRFHVGRRLRPYLGGGVGLFRYQETSELASDGENVDTRHAGGIVEGGVEVRLHRWIGAAADVRYALVPGVLGDSGLSKDAGESNLGGVSARFKILVGR